jgi:hypothetical protein
VVGCAVCVTRAKNGRSATLPAEDRAASIDDGDIQCLRVDGLERWKSLAEFGWIEGLDRWI